MGTAPRPALEPERLARVRAAVLKALVARCAEQGLFDAPGLERAESFPFPDGAALLVGRVGFVLCPPAGTRGLGAALAWAGKAGAEALHLIVADEGGDNLVSAGVLARRAGLFRSPPTVWRKAGAELLAVAPAPLPAEPPAVAPPELVELIRRAGAEPVLEHGVLRAEVLGLEVARAVREDGQWLLEVGVGRHDRAAQRMLGQDEPSAGRLRRAVEVVARHRRAGAPSHPANQLATERWLRAVVVANPELIGARALRPAPGTSVASTPAERTPALATGTDRDGTPIVVACSTGVDLELVPEAADARVALAADLETAPGPQARSASSRQSLIPRLVLVVPEGDDLPVTRALAGALADPAEVRTVPAAWRALCPSR